MSLRDAGQRAMLEAFAVRGDASLKEHGSPLRAPNEFAVLAPQQSATVYDSAWESIPILERLFGCQTMHHPADLRLEFVFEPEVRLAQNLQLVAVKSDAL